MFGSIIKEYKDDTPYPSKLMPNFITNGPIHMVVAQESNTNKCIVITTYEPMNDIWDLSFIFKK